METKKRKNPFTTLICKVSYHRKHLHLTQDKAVSHWFKCHKHFAELGLQEYIQNYVHVFTIDF